MVTGHDTQLCADELIIVVIYVVFPEVRVIVIMAVAEGY